MQEMPAGSMLAVPLPEQEVQRLLEWHALAGSGQWTSLYAWFGIHGGWDEAFQLSTG